jgi:hypothetical protein
MYIRDMRKRKNKIFFICNSDTIFKCRVENGHSFMRIRTYNINMKIKDLFIDNITYEFKYYNDW